MSYTGNVTVGGPAQSRELPGLDHHQGRRRPHGQQCLPAPLHEHRRAAADRRRERAGDAARPDRRHAAGHDRDHAPARRPLAGARGCGEGDRRRRRSRTPTTLRPSRCRRRGLVSHGDTIGVGDAQLSVIHLRGHTPGSIALSYDAGGALADQPHLFTGDSLFPGGPGNTEHDSERFNSLITDLENRIFGELPDGTWVYPGHGGDTTIGTERPHVPEWRARGW